MVIENESVFNPAVKATDYADPKKHQDHLFEQYKLFLHSADSVSERRHKTNLFFLTINGALLSVLGVTDPGGYGSLRGKLHVMVAILGICFGYVWYRLVRSHRDLNTGKFAVIHEIETRLPLSLYSYEWKKLGGGKNKNLYLPFSHIEIYLPWIAIGVYAIMLLAMLIKEYIVTS